MTLRRKISELIHSSARLKLVYFVHSHIKNLKIRKLFDILLMPIGILKLIFLSGERIKENDFTYKISIVCIVKNEASYIDEWIKYHLSIGIEHFYIYDNDSIDDLVSKLKKYSKYITYTKINGNVRQLDAYNDTLNRFANETEYLAVIDADEFLYCAEPDRGIYSIVNEYLKNRKIGGLVVNWIVYGSSHYEKKPKGLVTDNFLYRSHLNFVKNKTIKTICNPRKVFSFTISHAANYLPGYYAVNECYEPVPWAIAPYVSVSRLRLNHYYSKSKEEFISKRARGSGAVLAPRRLAEFDEHDKNDVFDDSLRMYNQKHHLS